MNAKVFAVICLFVGSFCLAQTAPSGTISSPPESDRKSQQSSRSEDRSSDREAPAYSLQQLSDNLHDLHLRVTDTLPVLESVAARAASALATNQPASGGLSGVLAGILGGSTNASSNGGSQPAITNLLGNILQGVLGSNTNSTDSAQSRAVADLVALRDHLQGIKPILERLDDKPVTDRVTGSQRPPSELQPTGRR